MCECCVWREGGGDFCEKADMAAAGGMFGIRRGGIWGRRGPGTTTSAERAIARLVSCLVSLSHRRKKKNFTSTPHTHTRHIIAANRICHRSISLCNTLAKSWFDESTQSVSVKVCKCPPEVPFFAFDNRGQLSPNTIIRLRHVCFRVRLPPSLPPRNLLSSSLRITTSFSPSTSYCLITPTIMRSHSQQTRA